MFELSSALNQQNMLSDIQVREWNLSWWRRRFKQRLASTRACHETGSGYRVTHVLQVVFESGEQVLADNGDELLAGALEVRVNFLLWVDKCFRHLWRALNNINTWKSDVISRLKLSKKYNHVLWMLTSSRNWRMALLELNWKILDLEWTNWVAASENETQNDMKCSNSTLITSRQGA